MTLEQIKADIEKRLTANGWNVEYDENGNGIARPAEAE